MRRQHLTHLVPVSERRTAEGRRLSHRWTGETSVTGVDVVMAEVEELVGRWTALKWGDDRWQFGVDVVL